MRAIKFFIFILAIQTGFAQTINADKYYLLHQDFKIVEDSIAKKINKQNTIIYKTCEDYRAFYFIEQNSHWTGYFIKSLLVDGLNLPTIVDTLKKGEYTLGYLDYTVGIKNYQPLERMILQINPNPASHNVHFDIDLKNNRQALLQLFDMKGNMIKEFTVYSHQTFVDWDTSEIASGNYIVKLCVNDKISISKKLVLLK